MTIEKKNQISFILKWNLTITNDLFNDHLAQKYLPWNHRFFDFQSTTFCQYLKRDIGIGKATSSQSC